MIKLNNGWLAPCFFLFCSVFFLVWKSVFARLFNTFFVNYCGFYCLYEFLSAVMRALHAIYALWLTATNFGDCGFFMMCYVFFIGIVRFKARRSDSLRMLFVFLYLFCCVVLSRLPFGFLFFLRHFRLSLPLGYTCFCASWYKFSASKKYFCIELLSELVYNIFALYATCARLGKSSSGLCGSKKQACVLLRILALYFCFLYPLDFRLRGRHLRRYLSLVQSVMPSEAARQTRFKVTRVWGYARSRRWYFGDDFAVGNFEFLLQVATRVKFFTQ